ncbi:MAG: lysine--tRNA ligase [Chloroflexi bacterium]|nr:lysine--tRNA ligase [Chloroflexota bacterium]
MSDLDQRGQRIAKLAQLRAAGVDPYPPRCQRSHTAAEALAAFEQAAEGQEVRVCVAGRLISQRLMGKTTFAHLADGSGRIQVMARQDLIGEAAYQAFKELDLADFINVNGKLFRTRTGEVTVLVDSFQLLAKALRPLPEKWHGLRDTETRYRQRYLDLIANEEVRHIFLTRTRIISAIRRFLDARGFIEVETPILQPLYGGAAAQPFTTHHNALDQTLYLRIADELYLKRLIIGGFERVYEIGHNFRNEGISTRHNPEFTAIELYQAYADYNDIMALLEELYAEVAQEVLGSSVLQYQGQLIDLTPPWRRISMRQAILDASGIDILEADTYDKLAAATQAHGLNLGKPANWGKLVEKLFEETVEPSLVQPTYITEFPLDISPLAKKTPADPMFVERFEFFIAGMECGNAFTELNDPLDQRERFQATQQDFKSGEDEAHPLDEDFIIAMEHGMPPTGGLGWGIDRMVMLFTDQASIREVILFPQLRSRD